MMSSKMAFATRIMQVVKPHASLTRFPNRRDKPKLSDSEGLGSAALCSHSSVISQHSKGNMSPDLLMHQGPPDTVDIINVLPQKFRRKPMSQKEMELSSVGVQNDRRGCCLSPEKKD
uniref:28S ribosomal protein S36, mitochondrial-like n=1 Tax=Arvicanthis niloticus TaxID=61156 RepID=UPI001486738F|nr:28S ribosomal protein S36, mitochondrial-like [Arvicanthis niloticus]